MRLLLTVLGLQRSTLGDRSTHIFAEAGGTLGRSASCDWILPDERNTLSARHARISHNGRGFLITDTSTNGVYLNTVDAPLGRDQSAPLSNGDTIYLADYIISVAILREELASAPMPVPMPAAAAPSVPAAPPPVVPLPMQPVPVAAPAIPMGLELSTPAPAMPASIPVAAQRQPTQLPGLIPDDFDFSDLAPATPQAAPAPAVAVPAPPVPLAAAIPMSSAEPVGSQPAPAAVDPLALLRQRAMARAASIDLTPQEPGASPPHRPIADVALPGGAPASNSGDAAAFWSGIGLDPARIPPEARARLLEELGGALRQAAGGLVSMLSARKSMKDEFRLDQTRLAPQENNPFKFFSHGDEALRRVVVEGAPGFLPLDMAVKQCFADMHAHEVALASAVQTGIRELLDRLAPSRLEAEAEPGLLGRKPDRSRLWERYAELHGDLAGDLDRTIRTLVSDELARASVRPGVKA